MRTIPAREIKRCGISVVDTLLNEGPVHVIKNDRPTYVIMTEAHYEELVEAFEDANVAGVREVLDAVKMMGTQVLDLTQAFTPLVNSSVGQVPPAQTASHAARTTAQLARTTARVAQTAAQLARTAGRAVEDQATVDAEVMEINPPDRPARKVDYLSVLAHISKLGTKKFADSVDPIEADEWRSRLARNFL